MKVLVVKDEDGIMRPMAGIWVDNQAGQWGAEEYLSKHRGFSIVKAELAEL